MFCLYVGIEGAVALVLFEAEALVTLSIDIMRGQSLPASLSMFFCSHLKCRLRLVLLLVGSPVHFSLGNPCTGLEYSI